MRVLDKKEARRGALHLSLGWSLLVVCLLIGTVSFRGFDAVSLQIILTIAPLGVAGIVVHGSHFYHRLFCALHVSGTVSYALYPAPWRLSLSSSMVNVVPWPTSLSTLMRPPCVCTNCRAMASPNPLPAPLA